jgi:hypothetical protein
MAAHAAAISDFGTALPDSDTGWLGSSATPESTNWYELKPSTCVQTYGGPNGDTYDAISCDQPHQAQFMIWVDMPNDWDGYQSDAQASAVVTARCGELQASFSAFDDGTAVVVDSSQIGEDQIVDDVHLAQCWAHRADLADLTVDLRSLL